MNTIAIFPSCQACLVWLYIVQCGAQLTFGSFVLWRLVTVWFNSAMRCSIVVGAFCYVYHVRGKSNLAVLNTSETNTIAIFPSCQACLVWLYIVQCGSQLTFGSFL